MDIQSGKTRKAAMYCFIKHICYWNEDHQQQVYVSGSLLFTRAIWKVFPIFLLFLWNSPIDNEHWCYSFYSSISRGLLVFLFVCWYVNMGIPNINQWILLNYYYPAIKAWKELIKYEFYFITSLVNSSLRQSNIYCLLLYFFIHREYFKIFLE